MNGTIEAKTKRLHRSEPCAGAFFVLRLILRSAHTARSFYYVVATDWQAAAAADYGEALPYDQYGATFSKGVPAKGSCSSILPWCPTTSQ